MLVVIDDILDFSKIEAGKLSLDLAEFRLRDALADTLKSLALRAHRKGLELNCDVSPNVPDLVVGDVGRLRQVLINLVGNAIKFTEQGEVVVRAELRGTDATGQRILFSVSDTGIGISPKKQRAIFDPFTQANGSTSRKYGGTGLGLTISARLVGLMGGRLEVESAAGRGSRFHFEAAFRRADCSPSRIWPPRLIDLRDVAVLVVDDNATNRRILEEALCHWGTCPTVVDGGIAALAELRRSSAAGKRYPLMLIDAMMPDMDGFTLAEQVLREPEMSTPAIMMLSSADRQADAERCRRLGLAAYLIKSIRLEELQRAIGEVLGTGQLTPTPTIQNSAAPIPAQELRFIKPLRVLLAEDNIVNQRVTVRMLEKQGHSVRMAVNGREAVAALNGEDFDVILMDVQMPEMDGFEATAIIREREKSTGTHVPIIAMTAHAMKGDRERCLAAGMDGYVSKPIRTGAFHQVLDSVLRVAHKEAPASVEPQGIEPVFDLKAALERVGGDEQFLAEVIGLFREDGPRLLGEVRDAVDKGDVSALQKSAHALKGSAGYVGGRATVRAAQELETMGQDRDVAAARIAVPLLEQELKRLLVALVEAGQPVS